MIAQPRPYDFDFLTKSPSAPTPDGGQLSIGRGPQYGAFVYVEVVCQLLDGEQHFSVNVRKMAHKYIKVNKRRNVCGEWTRSAASQWLTAQSDAGYVKKPRERN